MTASRVMAPVVIACVVLAARAPAGRAAQDAPQGQTFRSMTSGVTVDVSVRERNGRPITKLEPADFEVLDNGVPQTVASLSYGKLPIDITVAFDMSHSVTGAVLDRLRRGVVQLMGDLGKQDRLKLVLFNMRVNRIVDFTADVGEVERAMKTVAASGSTSLRDAVSVSLVSSSAPDRRHLIVCFTDGSDTTSVTTPATLVTTARRARATLTFVMPGGTVSTFAPIVGSSNQTQMIQTMRTVPAAVDPLYTTLAQETGGSVLPVGASSDLSMTFRQILEQFRSAYVLYFAPKGAEPGGYHTLEVHVKRENAVVQARRGYSY